MAPYEHPNIHIAPPITVLQPEPLFDIDAVMHEQPTDGIAPWSFATPSDLETQSHPVSTLGDTVSA